MITAEKTAWIKKNIYRGCRSEVAKNLAIEYSVVYDIITGKLWGTHGESVIEEVEKLIRARLKIEAQQKKKYG